jgi:glycosyltransferase involved in cell wall biosynthesis
MKTAIVYDWLVTYGGAERVLEEVLSLYPEGDVYSLIDFLPAAQRSFLRGRRVHVSFLQRLPQAGTRYRQYLPFMPAAVERFDLSGYDLIISLSHAVAKGILTSANQLHVCYLQARNLKYAYDDRHLYPGNRVKKLLEDVFLSRIRVWDSVASRRPDITIANSQFVSRWHRHRHGVPTTVIYPPVDTALFAGSFQSEKDDYYVTVARLEAYKRIDLIVQAFARLDLPLLIVGSGTQLKALQALAGPRTRFMGYQPKEEVARTIARAKAFVFAGQEDFGIAPVEAQASGTPVIAYAGGGALESIRGLSDPTPTGILFDEQTVPALMAAVERFEQEPNLIDPGACRKNALGFGQERFRREFAEYVANRYGQFRADRDAFMANNPKG